MQVHPSFSMSTDRSKMAYILNKIKGAYLKVEAPTEEDIKEILNMHLKK